MVRKSSLSCVRGPLLKGYADKHFSCHGWCRSACFRDTEYKAEVLKRNKLIKSGLAEIQTPQKILNNREPYFALLCCSRNTAWLFRFPISWAWSCNPNSWISEISPQFFCESVFCLHACVGSASWTIQLHTNYSLKCCFEHDQCFKTIDVKTQVT